MVLWIGLWVLAFQVIAPSLEATTLGNKIPLPFSHCSGATAALAPVRFQSLAEVEAALGGFAPSGYRDAAHWESAASALHQELARSLSQLAATEAGRRELEALVIKDIENWKRKDGDGRPVNYPSGADREQWAAIWERVNTPKDFFEVMNVTENKGFVGGSLFRHFMNNIGQQEGYASLAFDAPESLPTYRDLAKRYYIYVALSRYYLREKAPF